MKTHVTVILLILGISMAAWGQDQENTGETMPDKSSIKSEKISDDRFSSRNVSFGFIGTFGAADIFSKDSGVETEEPGPTVGGGFVFEKMFSNHFGIHSGLIYRYMEVDFTADVDMPDPLEATWSFHTINIPVLLIASANTENFSFNLLFGLTYINIFQSEIENRSSFPFEMESQKALSYINPHQVAVTGGINLKFRVTKFTDFFVGAIADFHPTNLFRSGGGNDHLSIYSGRVMAGYMFRTDIFPIPARLF